MRVIARLLLEGHAHVADVSITLATPNLAASPGRCHAAYPAGGQVLVLRQVRLCVTGVLLVSCLPFCPSPHPLSPAHSRATHACISHA